MVSNSSKLLIDENPLQVLPKLAKLIGLNEAIVLQQIHYWLKHNEAGKDGYKFREGRWWTYGSVKEWHTDNFPFWSENTIQRIFANLEQAGLIVSKKFNAAKYDHTKWYTIDYDRLDEITESIKKDEPITPDSGNQEPQDDAILILTETNTETNTEKKESRPRAKRTPPPADPEKAKRNEETETIARALSEITGMDYIKNIAVLKKEAKHFVIADLQTLKEDYSPPSGAWYLYDWRGQKGERPGLHVIRPTFRNLKPAAAPTNGNGQRKNAPQVQHYDNQPTEEEVEQMRRILYPEKYGVAA